MARKVRDGVVLIWGSTGAAVVLRRMAPGVIHLIGVRNFDGPFEDGPMSDFDREIAAHGSLQLFMDVRKTQRSSSKSREPWKEWASQNRTRHRSHVLVSSSILHMAISVIAMASKTVTTAYANEAAFLRALQEVAPGVTALPDIPPWVSETLTAAVP
ncbi:MAG TPA: hypothetical protein VMF89_03900 [Polyangiales bacterium]|nr:hypothetical protein [Polyangiales bacterium]